MSSQLPEYRLSPHTNVSKHFQIPLTSQICEVIVKSLTHKNVMSFQIMKGKYMDYGYARVSAKDQNLARQLDAMRELGLNDDAIFTDKASGKDFNRPSYQRLLRKLKPADVVFVKSIDRLGRNYQEIIEEWRNITQKRGAHIVVLDMPLLDTRNDKGEITSIFITDIVLQLLSYVAQVERENIKQRQAEGIASARPAAFDLEGRR